MTVQQGSLETFSLLGCAQPCARHMCTQYKHSGAYAASMYGVSQPEQGPVPEEYEAGAYFVGGGQQEYEGGYADSEAGQQVGFQVLLPCTYVFVCMYVCACVCL